MGWIVSVFLFLLCTFALGQQDTASYWRDKGVDLFSKQVDESLNLFEKAIELDPMDAIAWSYKGTALDALSKYNEALQAYNRAIEINPNCVLAWNNKGVTLDFHRNHKEAIEAYDKAIELNPDFAVAWLNKGVALNALGRSEEALAAYEKADKLDSKLYLTGAFGYDWIFDILPEPEKATRCFYMEPRRSELILCLRPESAYGPSD